MNLNRYRVEGNRYIFHTFKQGQKFNTSVWQENDNRFEKKTEIVLNEDGVESIIDVGYYIYYNLDGTPDLVKEQEAIDLAEAQKAKEEKVKALDELQITHNTVAYDANGKAIGNMSAVMGVANFKYNQAVSNGTSPAEAYQVIYKDTKIWWKGADDLPHEVMIESVCEALEKSMLAIASILGV